MATIFPENLRLQRPGWESPVGSDGEMLFRTMFGRWPEEDGEAHGWQARANDERDKETEAIVCNVFGRNLQSTLTVKSQYGYTHVAWSSALSVLVEEALGTTKAKDILRKEAREALQQLGPTYSVAVWRKWPSIDRCPGGTNRLKLRMRLHVMTEAAYQAFAQQEPL